MDYSQPAGPTSWDQFEPRRVSNNARAAHLSGPQLRVVKTTSKGWEILAYPDETDQEAIERLR